MPSNAKNELKTRQFAKVHIEISNVCNLQCSFCPAVERKKGFMTLVDFKQVIEQVAPLAEQVCLHLMGEPLLHPHFADIVEVCKNRGVQIFLVSNGVLLREKTISLLQDECFRQLNFSLHSFKDNFAQKDPSSYLEKIFVLTEQAFVSRPDLYINYRLWNLQDPRGQTDENRSMMKMIEDRFGVAVPVDLDVRHKKSFRLKNRLYLHFDTEFVWPHM
ncbi:MAG: radical SAM protein, partial [Proteobacteria bacterium]|nr:radical SAM protein [Pseudomonadota bacterium]